MTELRIVSGGQTGADRAALDWALRNSVSCGGWCPKGRIAEDGRIADRYPLQETPTPTYRQRTDWNTRDSDGTVLFSLAAELTEGSLTTVLRATANRRPWLHFSATMLDQDASRAAIILHGFLKRHQIQTLNIAGPRASKEPLVAPWVDAVLDHLLPLLRDFS